MVEQTSMQMDEGDDVGLGRGTMVTALCWISRGYAKPMLQEADPEEDDIQMKQHLKMQKKIAR